MTAKKIEDITPEQWTEIYKIRDSWANEEQVARYRYPEVLETVQGMFKSMDRDCPLVFTVDSPEEALLMSWLLDAVAGFAGAPTREDLEQWLIDTAETRARTMIRAQLVIHCFPRMGQYEAPPWLRAEIEETVLRELESQVYAKLCGDLEALCRADLVNFPHREFLERSETPFLEKESEAAMRERITRVNAAVDALLDNRLQPELLFAVEWGLPEVWDLAASRTERADPWTTPEPGTILGNACNSLTDTDRLAKPLMELVHNSLAGFLERTVGTLTDRVEEKLDDVFAEACQSVLLKCDPEELRRQVREIQLCESMEIQDTLGRKLSDRLLDSPLPDEEAERIERQIQEELDHLKEAVENDHLERVKPETMWSAVQRRMITQLTHQLHENPELRGALTGG